ncbi:hypothetical protein SAMN05421805_11816 [Saccharopolyspora antimicrobica]|uniref:Uncharacterized protein n=1 Tax=Saccharopolyspora antimicrobica TaxID=455193 RepID=A0A1I5I9P7_9PSEU|nr:hypothetical protein [Saccharopolyspora antimicrobica]RKT85583.1 hypothetical protein ATL45_3930 [Saccharopolyspora antimicrobica]SFO57335.1 hypothetical protein SAMN05421805_11816 [Saccharopolyspora antimicrobica]
MSSSEIDLLLTELGSNEWTVWVFGPKHGPGIVAAVHRWQTCADVVILRGETGDNDATAFRTPTMLGSDPFVPVLVSWQYHSSAVWTLRAVLALPEPGHPDAPIAVLRPDRLCFLPDDLGRPVTIRPSQLIGPSQPRRLEGANGWSS